MDPIIGPMEAIFTACDITSLGTLTSALLVGFVTVSLGFVAYRYARKAGIR